MLFSPSCLFPTHSLEDFWGLCSVLYDMVATENKDAASHTSRLTLTSLAASGSASCRDADPGPGPGGGGIESRSCESSLPTSSASLLDLLENDAT